MKFLYVISIFMMMTTFGCNSLSTLHEDQVYYGMMKNIKGIYISPEDIPDTITPGQNIRFKYAVVNATGETIFLEITPVPIQLLGMTTVLRTGDENLSCPEMTLQFKFCPQYVKLNSARYDGKPLVSPDNIYQLVSQDITVPDESGIVEITVHMNFTLSYYVLGKEKLFQKSLSKDFTMRVKGKSANVKSPAPLPAPDDKAK